MIHVESEEPETDIMASLVKVLAEAISGQGVRRRSRSGRAMTKEFSQRSDTHFALLAWFGEAVHSGAPKILNQESAVLESFRDGGPPGLKATCGFEKGLKGLAQVVACLGEVLGRGLLRLTRIRGCQEQGKKHAPDCGSSELLQQIDYVRQSIHTPILAQLTHERLTDLAACQGPGGCRWLV